MKKHFIVFAAIILTVSLLAGCGGSSGKPVGSAQSGKEAAMVSADEGVARDEDEKAFFENLLNGRPVEKRSES